MPWLAVFRRSRNRSVWPRLFPVIIAFVVGLTACAIAPADGPATEMLPGKVRASLTALRAEVLRELGAARWHRLGYRGRGVTVAVLDTGFRGYRAHLGEALPKQVTVRSFRQDGNLEAKASTHGILCAEVIHAVAPESRLLFANWDSDRPDQFLQAAQWARREGAQVISCSLIMPSWSDGEGGGPVDDALARIVGAGTSSGDVLFFASAGNTASRHWSGSYHEAGLGFHEWAPGAIDDAVTPWGTDRVSIEMCWQTSANYEVLVVDGVTGRPVARSAGKRKKGSAQRSCAVARFTPRDGQSYRVRVRLLDGRPCRFHLVALGGELSRSRARGSVSCPADGPAVVAVGAVDRVGKRVWYSACGPNSAKPKPDFVAAVPFPSLWRERPFTGTSAAAPQAAASAALWWSRHPLWSARQVRVAMKASALDLGPLGHDYETGYGLVRLP